MSPNELARFMADDKARWQQMVEAAGISAE
jgi:hypothetical protein